MGNFFRNLASKYEAFWVGRNGGDTLGFTSLAIAVILLVINSFANNVILLILIWVFLIYSIFRSTSKNVAARQAEQEKFDSFKDRIFNRKSSGSKSSAQKNSYTSAKKPRKSHSGFSKNKKKSRSDKLVFNCESCGQSLSVPRNRGTLKVTCPKCGKTTTIKS